MSVIEDLKRKYAEMDEIDRKNLWIGVGFGVLLLLLVYALSNTFDTVGGILGNGATFVNGSLGGVNNLMNQTR